MKVEGEILRSTFEPANPKLREALEEFEKQFIAQTLKQNHGHRGKASEMLGLPRRTLSRKMKKYRITSGTIVEES